MDLQFFGGGRYDGLVKEVGGGDTPAVGWATGMDRLVDVFLSYNKDKLKEKNIDLYIASIGEEANVLAFKITNELRYKGIYVEKDICSRSIGSQFKYANKKMAKYVLTIGETEVKEKIAKIKNMESGEETDIPLDAEKILEYLA